jgi:arginine:pyruvate transaminase
MAAPPFIQDGALAALSDDLTEVAALREDYRRRAAWISELLGAMPGCRAVPPGGGMFVLLDVRARPDSLRTISPADCLKRRGRGLALRRLWPEHRGPSTHRAQCPEPRLRDAANRILRLVHGLNRPLMAARPLSKWAAQ